MLAPMQQLFKRWLMPDQRLAESADLPAHSSSSRDYHLWNEAPAPAVDRVLEHLEQSDRLLLAALKRGEASRPVPPGFQGVFLGNDRLLAAHPLVPFIYLHSRELQQTPYIVAGQFQPQLSLLLECVVRPGDKVVEFAAGQGFHTLSLARHVGPTGQVVALENEKTYAAVLRDNVTAHELGDVVDVVSKELDNVDLVVLSEGVPDVIRIDERCQPGKLLPGLERHLHDNLRIVLSFPRRQGKELAEPLRQLGLPLWRHGDGGELQAVSIEDVVNGLDASCHLLAARRLI